MCQEFGKLGWVTTEVLVSAGVCCRVDRAYLYLDEAHSIGCMGAHGKGLCEHAGVDPKDVDVLMGEQPISSALHSVARWFQPLSVLSVLTHVSMTTSLRHLRFMMERRTVGASLLSQLAGAACLTVMWCLTVACAGTFTKSFGSAGGYIAGSKQLIAYLRRYCPAHLYATSMAPGVMQQIISAIKLLQVRPAQVDPLTHCSNHPWLSEAGMRCTRLYAVGVWLDAVLTPSMCLPLPV
jgi:hypothetical protein